MHFALPPRKTSFPPPYARVSARDVSSQRRRLFKLLTSLLAGLLTIYLIFSVVYSGEVSVGSGSIKTDASVLIVTVLDESRMSDEYVSMIKKNRNDYASRHGYKTFYASAAEYKHLTEASPSTWALIPALRHALTKYPESDYIWSLTPDAVITNTSTSLHDHVFAKLPSLMLKDIPVVPPDSVIHTFSHLKPEQVYLILTQDAGNVAPTSFILRNTDTVQVMAGHPKDTWSQYFLDAWFDPLYRAYAFQKAENHALEHIIQWHPTLLAKLAIVEQRVLNSYIAGSLVSGDGSNTVASPDSGIWRPGDLIINLKDCHVAKERDCTAEMKKYLGIWDESAVKTEKNGVAH